MTLLPKPSGLFRTTRLSALAALLLSTSVPAVAQAACSLDKLLEVPVAMSGPRAFVDVEVNGQRMNFLADSGATFSSLDPAAARALKLSSSVAPMNLRVTGVGGDANPMVAEVGALRLAGVDLGRRTLLVLPAGSGVDGILGQDVLGSFDVEYDFPHGAIRLFRPHGCERASLAYWAGQKPFSELGIDKPTQSFVDGTTAWAELNGVRIKVSLDSGAEASVLSKGAAARIDLKPGGPGVTAAGMMYGAGRRPIQVWRSSVASFKMGNEEVKNIALRFGDVDLRNADMLLGADFFLSHRIYVSNQQHKLYLTYEGGPLFGRSPQAAGGSAPARPVLADAPQGDAEGAFRRATLLMAQGNLSGAIADFGRAMELGPDEPKYALARAKARIANRQPALAMADLDQALRLVPAADTYVMRAQLRLSERDTAGAGQDLEAAARLAPETADLHLTLGDLYRQASRFDAAIVEYSRWMSAHQGDARTVNALFGRCRARALVGVDLDKALADCNRALNLAPNAAGALQTRAIVRFKSGDADHAIADYDAALAILPKDALSLYGRGLAKLKKGLKEEGQADLAAATALQPRIADQAQAYGLAKASA